MKTQRQTGSDRRLILLQAALDLFSTQGYEGATTRGIARRAGVTEALLFKHFQNKQALLRAVVEEFGPRRMFTAPPEAIHALPVLDALRHLLSLYLDTFWINRACLRMLFMATERDRSAFDELRAQFGRQTHYLFSLLILREDTGELRKGVAVAATDIISASITGYLQRTLRDEPSDWDAARTSFIDHLVRILAGGILAEKNVDGPAIFETPE